MPYSFPRTSCARNSRGLLHRIAKARAWKRLTFSTLTTVASFVLHLLITSKSRWPCRSGAVSAAPKRRRVCAQMLTVHCASLRPHACWLAQISEASGMRSRALPRERLQAHAPNHMREEESQVNQQRPVAQLLGENISKALHLALDARSKRSLIARSS